MSLQPAYLLHRRPYRETSALVDLITLEHGLIRGVARGVARPKSKSRSNLQPFTPLHVAWRGERDLKTLTLIESTKAGVMLAGEGLLCGFYANELLARCLPREFPVESVFAHYGALLEALKRPAERAPGLRRLEITLLEALDAEPVFETEAGQSLSSQQAYLYQVVSRRFTVASGHTQGLDGRQLRRLAMGEWESPVVAREARWLLRQALLPYIGDRPLKSRALLMSLVEKRRRQSLS